MSYGKQTPIIRALVDFLGRRKIKEALRFPDDLVPRSMPPPALPDGPSHKIADNYYYTRDARREESPPVAVFTAGSTKAIEGVKQPLAAKQVTEHQPKMPGIGYNISGLGYYGPANRKIDF
ncbi:NADH dehydrogenase [ubiquinone] 1 alpha subcomplex subunit 7-like [Mercenaria mercenaria]|uniref:NADH dehydrogenase [ubiquinone] 1 alpha subcomplex subunit 7-like n=1 Tax=Mercenaria mercenaria TaxID=6596 RepID=UPI00234E49CE|nr:NADH dehydrogenase [ubiquinone] 1 alpha subcomplex subunit 7-like [Mercenaria mercenaria]